MAHARRDFHELCANHGSQVGEQALKVSGHLYDVEREAAGNDVDARRAARQQRSRPLVDAQHQWLSPHRQKVPDGVGHGSSDRLHPEPLGGIDALHRR
jgi:hypothetical protein